MWFPSTKWKRSSVSVVPRPGNQQTPFGVWPDDAEDPNRRGLGRESTHHLGTMRPRGHVVHIRSPQRDNHLGRVRVRAGNLPGH